TSSWPKMVWRMVLCAFSSCPASAVIFCSRSSVTCSAVEACEDMVFFFPANAYIITRSYHRKSKARMSFTKKPQIESDERYDIKILRDGTWLYGGTPMTRHNMVKLFSTVLKKDEKGDYWLETPYE